MKKTLLSNLVVVQDWLLKNKVATQCRKMVSSYYAFVVIVQIMYIIGLLLYFYIILQQHFIVGCQLDELKANLLFYWQVVINMVYNNDNTQFFFN